VLLEEVVRQQKTQSNTENILNGISERIILNFSKVEKIKAFIYFCLLQLGGGPPLGRVQKCKNRQMSKI